MKIGVFTVLLANRPFEEALDYLKDLGVEAVEIGCGAYPGEAHCKPAELLSSDPDKHTEAVRLMACRLWEQHSGRHPSSAHQGLGRP